jgi:hypothetical protein
LVATAASLKNASMYKSSLHLRSWDLARRANEGVSGD